MMRDRLEALKVFAPHHDDGKGDANEEEMRIESENGLTEFFGKLNIIDQKLSQIVEKIQRVREIHHTTLERVLSDLDNQSEGLLSLVCLVCSVCSVFFSLKLTFITI